MPITVLFENADVTLCLKPAGASAEDTPGSPCVPALLRERWGSTDAYVGVIHRLDTPAAGLMVYARNPRAAAFLSRQVQEGTLKKEYLALCAGTPPQGELRDYLYRDRQKSKVYPVKTARRGAKEALAECTVLAAGETGSLCLVRLHTGRTHQIRVQLASRGCPLHGDGKYGSRVKGALALWCCRLTLTLPGERAPRVFTAPPPADGPFAACAAAAAEALAE